MAEAGTRVEILDVVYEQIELLEDEEDTAIGPGWRLLTEWTVTGIVTHAGHSHARANRYSAVFTVQRLAQGLRITDTRLKDLKRVPSERVDFENWRRSRPAVDEALRSLSDLLREGAVAPPPLGDQP